MTPPMIIPEIALNHSGPGVQQSPTNDTQSAAYGSEIVHGSRDRQDSDGKDDFQENDRCSRPFDCAEIDAGRSLEDLVFFVGVEDAASSCARAKSIVFDVERLGVGWRAFFLVR